MDAWVLGEEVKEPEKPPKDASEEDKAKYEQDKEAYDYYVYKVELKLWYVDQYLMQAAGAEFWGPKIKPYYLPVDKFQLGDALKMRVPAAAEAFGLVQYENSRKRWLNVFKWKKKNPGKGKKPPSWSKSKPETAPFKCTWSDYAHGQGSGWDPQAYRTYIKRLAAVQAFRKEEEEEDYPQMMAAQAMIKAHYGIPEEETEPPKKKRKKEVEVVGSDDETVADEDFVIEVVEE